MLTVELGLSGLFERHYGGDLKQLVAVDGMVVAAVETLSDRECTPGLLGAWA